MPEERLEICEPVPEASNGDAAETPAERDFKHGDAVATHVIHNSDSEDATATHTSYLERTDRVYNTGEQCPNYLSIPCKLYYLNLFNSSRSASCSPKSLRYAPGTRTHIGRQET